MKIINGRDYYDFAHAGIDETITFERNMVIVSFNEDETPFNIEPISGAPRVHWLGGCLKTEDGNVLFLEPIFVFVAGVTHPALRVARVDIDWLSGQDYDARPSYSLCASGHLALYYDDSEIIYDRESAMEAVGKVEKKSARDFSFGRGKRTLEQIVNDHFAIAKDVHTDFLVKERIVTGMAFCERSSQHNVYQLFKNVDFLGELKFNKVMDGFTLNQEIARFISGVLPSPSASTVDISDKHRIQKGGFDLKYGFRTRPSK